MLIAPTLTILNSPVGFGTVRDLQRPSGCCVRHVAVVHQLAMVPFLRDATKHIWRRIFAGGFCLLNKLRLECPHGLADTERSNPRRERFPALWMVYCLLFGFAQLTADRRLCSGRILRASIQSVVHQAKRAGLVFAVQDVQFIASLRRAQPNVQSRI